MMNITEDVGVSDESKWIIPFSLFPMIKFDSLIRNVVKNGNQCVCGCVIPRIKYESRGVIPCNWFPMTEVSALMIILAKYGGQLGCGGVSLRGRYYPKLVIPYIFLYCE